MVIRLEVGVDGRDFATAVCDDNSGHDDMLFWLPARCGSFNVADMSLLGGVGQVVCSGRVLSE